MLNESTLRESAIIQFNTHTRYFTFAYFEKDHSNWLQHARSARIVISSHTTFSKLRPARWSGVCGKSNVTHTAYPLIEVYIVYNFWHYSEASIGNYLIVLNCVGVWTLCYRNYILRKIHQLAHTYDCSLCRDRATSTYTCTTKDWCDNCNDEFSEAADAWYRGHRHYDLYL